MARAWVTLAEPCQFAQNRDRRPAGVGGHDESTSHVCVRTPFELEWTDSEMAEGSWRWDQMHNPTPLSPLSIEMSDLVLESLVREAGATHDEPLADPLPQHLDLVTGPGDARRLSQCTGLRLEALQDEGGIAAARRLGLIEGLAESRLAGAVGQYEVYYRPGAVRNNSILSHSDESDPVLNALIDTMLQTRDFEEQRLAILEAREYEAGLRYFTPNQQGAAGTFLAFQSNMGNVTDYVVRTTSLNAALEFPPDRLDE